MFSRFVRKLAKQPLFTLAMLAIIFSGAAFTLRYVSAQSVGLSPIEELGKRVFFDKISTPKRMACVTCHHPETGGTGGVSGVNLHEVAVTGANPHTVGNLKPPTNAYASFIELFKPCARGGLGPNNVCGGNFWNGRAEGNVSALFPAGATKHIGEEIFYRTSGGLLPLTSEAMELYARYFGPTADQALNPMPNPVEQNINRQAVCNHVKFSKYAKLYKKVWEVDIDCSDTPVTVHASDVDAETAFDISFKRIMLAVCAWQASADLNSFSSKRDIALREDSDGQFPLDGLTAQENLGHDLFYNTKPVPFAPEVGANVRPFPGLPVTNCSFCHVSGPRVGVAPALLGTHPEERYADDAYHIIGTPRNPEIPATYTELGELIDPDLGLFGHTGRPGDRGFFRTPTLRNVDKRRDEEFIKAYTHNGWFKSLESLVHFYNTSLIGGATANSYGVTRCPAGIEKEKEALANNCWPEPAFPGASPVLIGNLGMTLEQEAALVAYLKTFTDTHTAVAPVPYKNK